MKTSIWSQVIRTKNRQAQYNTITYSIFYPSFALFDDKDRGDLKSSFQSAIGCLYFDEIIWSVGKEVIHKALLDRASISEH